MEVEIERNIISNDKCKYNKKRITEDNMFQARSLTCINRLSTIAGPFQSRNHS